MSQPAPTDAAISEEKRSRNPNAPRDGFMVGAGWGMLACGLAVGLAVGQFTGHRGVRAELYLLKQDLRDVRRTAEALTGAAGRGGETTTLLADLAAQRESVREAAATWTETGRTLAAAAKPLARSKALLADGAAIFTETREILSDADALRGGVLDDAEAWAAAAADSRDAAGAAAAELTDLRAAVLAGGADQPAAEATLRRMLAVQRRLGAESENAAAARLAAAETAAAHRDLIAQQARALAAAREAMGEVREVVEELAGGAATVSAEAADAATGLHAAAIALADLSALKQMVAAAGRDFPAVWRSLDRLFTLRDTLLAEDPTTARIAAGPADDVE